MLHNTPRHLAELLRAKLGDLEPSDLAELHFAVVEEFHRRRRGMNRRPTTAATWAFWLCCSGLFVLAMLVLKGCHL